MRLPSIIIGCLGVLALAACGDEPSEPDDGKQQSSDQGREETKKVEALDAVGHDGGAVRKHIDQNLDQIDERNAEMEQTIDGQ